MPGDAVILTPLSTGFPVPAGDLGFPRVFSECPAVSSVREININVNRARLQNLYKSRLAHRYPYVYLIDADVVVTADDLVKLRCAWNGPGTTACINTKGGPTGHVVASCCFMSGNDYARVDYMVNAHECQCLKLPGTYYVELLGGTEEK